jgi:hypothetical protein
VLTKQKTRKRKRLQHDSTLEYSKVAASAALVANLLKKTCSSRGAKGATAT